MAISLSTTFPSHTTFHPTKHPYHHSLSNIHSVSFSLLPNSVNRTINRSSPQDSKIAVSAVSGSSGIAASEVSEDTASLLDRVEVFNLNGNGIPISDLWKERKAIVAFARHFGCVLCRKRADYLAAKKDIMDAAGVALVLIGPGSVDQAKAFSEQAKFKGEVYADPSYSSYEALRFVSGVSTTFTPGAGLKIIEAYMEGYRQDWKLSFEKDTRTRGGWQQGGIIVAGPGKSNISYIHKLPIKMRNTPKNLKLTHHDIQKDITNAAAYETTNAILKDMGEAFFSILVDESCDISNKEQMAVVLRYVNKKDKEAGDDPAIEDILQACCS